TGLAMLSTLPDAGVRRLLDGLSGGWPAPLTDHGLRDTESVIAELRQIRQRQYSIDREAVREGMYCFGAPVFDSRNPEAVAGVAVSIHSLEANTALEERAGQAIRKLADRMSERLGAWRAKKKGPHGTGKKKPKIRRSWAKSTKGGGWRRQPWH